MAELDQLLEKDAVVLMSMKRELEEAQKNEIARAYAHLNASQKEHDFIHRENLIREKKLQSLVDSLMALQNVVKFGSSEMAEGKTKIDTMNAELEDFSELLEAEQRTNKILRHISGTLDKEILSLQVASRELVDKTETAKHG